MKDPAINWCLQTTSQGFTIQFSSMLYCDWWLQLDDRMISCKSGEPDMSLAGSARVSGRESCWNRQWRGGESTGIRHAVDAYTHTSTLTTPSPASLVHFSTICQSFSWCISVLQDNIRKITQESCNLCIFSKGQSYGHRAFWRSGIVCLCQDA